MDTPGVAYGAKYRECHALVWDRACPLWHSNLSHVATKSGKDPRLALIIDLSRAKHLWNIMYIVNWGRLDVLHPTMHLSGCDV